MKTHALLLTLMMMHALSVSAQMQISWRAQASAWCSASTEGEWPLWLGARYLPQGNLIIPLNDRHFLEVEASVNINGNSNIKPFSEASGTARFKPYRVWARLSADQYELRLGLQKINFGSANLLRPLMWFDQLDPRDPLQLTDGVWGLLGRYYFLNNANLWLWGLWGNEGPKTWETSTTNQHFPELGGRFQTPAGRGELAASYHFRVADGNESVDTSSPEAIPEHRFGLDGKWDLGVGIWFEAVTINKIKDKNGFSHQEIISAGTDYTFALGNGLNVSVEHLLISAGTEALTFRDPFYFSGLSVSYPLGMFNQLQTLVYYDWWNRTTYRFVNWHTQRNSFDFYLMAFWNPIQYNLPSQNTEHTMFSGKGIQLMLVFNH
jgi:hypothetical protein